jgi:hypothetical protein
MDALASRAAPARTIRVEMRWENPDVRIVAGGIIVFILKIKIRKIHGKSSMILTRINRIFISATHPFILIK